MGIHKTVEPNTKGSDFFVGDIHGCFSTLEKLLDKAAFDPEVDRLFSVGDLINRGSESHRAIEFLKQPWFYAVAGNHEVIFMDYMEGGKVRTRHLHYLVDWVPHQTRKAMIELYEQIRALPIAITIESIRQHSSVGRVGVLHANISHHTWNDFITDLVKGGYESQTAYDAQWSRDRYNSSNAAIVSGVEAVYVGHKPVDHTKVLGNVYYIDTGCVYDNMLTLHKRGDGAVARVRRVR